MTKIMVLFACLVLAGCQTTAEAQSTRDKLESGEFTGYTKSEQQKLLEISKRFEEPGQSVSYVQCLGYMKADDYRQKAAATFYRDTTPPRVVRVFQKLLFRASKASGDELANVCSCASNFVWRDLTDPKKIAFNNLVMGIDINDKDRKALLEKSINLKASSKPYTKGPLSCVAKTFDMLDEFVEVEKGMIVDAFGNPSWPN